MEWREFILMAVGIGLGIIGFFIVRTLNALEKSITVLTEKFEDQALKSVATEGRIKAVEDRINHCKACAGE